MTRKWIDCRDYPDDVGCTLYLSGEEDTPELREQLRGMLKDEAAMPRRVIDSSTPEEVEK